MRHPMVRRIATRPTMCRRPRQRQTLGRRRTGKTSCPILTPRPSRPNPLCDLVLAAAPHPPGLLAALLVRGAGAPEPVRRACRCGASRRPAWPTHRRAPRQPQHGTRLNVIETLRAAAPWQTVRRREAQAAGAQRPMAVCGSSWGFPCLAVQAAQRRPRPCSSMMPPAPAALHRLARRKERSRTAAGGPVTSGATAWPSVRSGARVPVLLPPTRSLVRPSTQPGQVAGRGAPLACSIDAALALAAAVPCRARRR